MENVYEEAPDPAVETFHHFTLTPELLMSMEHKLVVETAWAMAEQNLLHLPYPTILVTCPLDELFDSPGWDWSQETGQKSAKLTGALVTFLMQETGVQAPIKFVRVSSVIYTQLPDGRSTEMNLSAMPEVSERLCQHWVNGATLAAHMLVTALSTKNVDANTSVNNRAARGIGHGKFAGPGRSGIIYRSTTTVRPPTFATGTGGTSPSPHWRAGHWNKYWTGPGRKIERKLYIPPIWVNGRDVTEPLTVDQRQNYLVGK